MSTFFNTKWLIAIIVLGSVLLGGYFVFFYAKEHKTEFAAGSLNIIQKVSKLLPIAPDTKKEIEVVNTLVSELTKSDDKVRVFLILLQNADELRPGGGFLGQYAIIKVKNGEVASTYVEDANLLDQRIVAKIAPPYPFKRKLQLKNWKFRDSNFSPDFPTNAEKAQYFYRLSGGREKFDAVIAVNSHVFNNILAVSGPIKIAGDSNTYTSEDGAYKLEERVERAYLGEDVPAELKQNRKAIMKKLAAEIMSRVATVGNMGALKSDYFMRRSLDYTVDFTGEKPVATILYTYKHTAAYGDWRTSDYHTYLRAYVPKGAKLIERKMVGSPLTDEAFNKTYFGVFVDVLIGGQTEGMIKYELPETVTEENYKLLIQKQSGVGTIPVNVHIKTKDGKVFDQTTELKKDLNLTIQEVEEKK